MYTTAWRIACFSALLALFVALVPNTAQAQGLGLAAGANFDRLSDIEADTDGALGYHVGLFYDARLGPLAIRPGVFYMDVGDIEFDDGEGPAEDFDLQLIEVPIDARFRLGTTPVLTPYLLAGPVFRINASGDDFGGNMEDFSLAANAGVGLEVSIQGTGVRLFPELRYSFGINDIATDLGFEGEDARLNNFMIRLGLAF